MVTCRRERLSHRRARGILQQRRNERRHLCNTRGHVPLYHLFAITHTDLLQATQLHLRRGNGTFFADASGEAGLRRTTGIASSSPNSSLPLTPVIMCSAAGALLHPRCLRGTLRRERGRRQKRPAPATYGQLKAERVGARPTSVSALSGRHIAARASSTRELHA